MLGKDPLFQKIFEGFELDQRWRDLIARVVVYALDRFEERTALTRAGYDKAMKESEHVGRKPDESLSHFISRLHEENRELHKTIAKLSDHVPMPKLFQDALIEVEKARQKYPHPNLLTLALAEEAGEIVKAALDHRQEKTGVSEVRKEIVQTIAMCLRLAQEGDPSVSLEPTDVR